MKKTVAVFIGGRSPEHDVSIVTGLQAFQALDRQAVDAFPVYIASDGAWYVGEALCERAFYIPDRNAVAGLEPVTLDLNPDIGGRGRLIPTKSKGLFGKKAAVEFDVALLAFHGYFGEDGRIQSLFELANVPYTGMRPLACSVFMDKAATKRFLASTEIPLLPFDVLDRPQMGLEPDDAALDATIEKIPFPAIIKPARLGSSIGVARVTNKDELRAAAADIFRLDTQAIVEPFVPNLVEYNVAVCGFDGAVKTSAVERPKSSKELLDFKEKYMTGAKGKSGTKTPGASSEGMLSLTRDINPDLAEAAEAKLRAWSEICFTLAYGTGAPRIDYVCNGETGEMWLNEVNACPGSFGYFLWEAAEQPMLFSELLSKLIDEALTCHRAIQLPADPTHPEARIFPRSLS